MGLLASAKNLALNATKSFASNGYVKSGMEMVSNLAGAAKEIWGYKRERQALTNSPEMKEAASQQKESDEQDRIRRDVASGDAERQARDIS